MLFFLAFSVASYAQQRNAPTIQWLKFEEAVAKNVQQPKKIFLDLYTDWCSWCKVMDRNTFSDAKVAAYMSKYFYAVKFDAEGKTPITFMENTFQYNAQYRAHELAVAFLQGQMSYPSTAYMDGSNQLLTVVPGYMGPDDFLPILVYFGGDHYLKMNWEDFQKEWPDIEKVLTVN